MKQGYLSWGLFFLLCTGTVTAETKWTVEGRPKVYSGDHGVSITMVALKPRKAGKVLILFEGTDTEWDDRVLLNEITETNRSSEFRAKWHGETWMTMSTGSSWWSSKRYQLHLPKRREAVGIYYDEKKSEKASAEDLVNRYLGRKPASSAFDRKEEEKKEQTTFAAVASSMNETCGTSINASIEWPSVKDDVLKQTQVGAGCGAPLVAIEKLCDDDVGKETIKKKIKQYVCRFSAKPEMQLSGTELVWITAKDTPDQEGTAKVFLENKL